MKKPLNFEEKLRLANKMGMCAVLKPDACLELADLMRDMRLFAISMKTPVKPSVPTVPRTRKVAT